MEVADALRAVGGRARWKQLQGHVSWRALQRARGDGTVLRSGRAYVLKGTGRGQVLAVQLDGVRSHVTAAEHWGLALPPRDVDVHEITIGRKAQRTDVPADARLHYRDYPPDHVEGDVTTTLTTVIDCLRDGSLQLALCVGDSALNQQLVTLDQLRERARGLRGPGSAVVRHRVELLDAGAANAFESSVRAILVEAGILTFRAQVSIRSGRQWIGRVDLADVVLRIVIECDGFGYHSDETSFVRDRVRMTSLVSAGWRPLQFTWEQVMFRRTWVLERVQETMRHASRESIAAQRLPGRAAPAA